MAPPLRVRLFGIAALCVALAACGSAAGGYAPAPAQTGGAVTQTPQTSSLSTLPILTDTSMSTAGVFLGAACGQHTAVQCGQFANTFRHGIALGTVYVTWDSDLASYMSNA